MSEPEHELVELEEFRPQAEAVIECEDFTLEQLGAGEYRLTDSRGRQIGVPRATLRAHLRVIFEDLR